MLVLGNFQLALYFLSVTVSFDPTTYTVTEGVDDVANLMLVRSGGLTRTIVVTVITVAGTATGITHHCLLPHCIRHALLDFQKSTEEWKYTIVIIRKYEL